MTATLRLSRGRRRPAPRRSRGRGLSLVEVLVAMTVGSLMLAAGLQAATAARVADHRAATRARGKLLAQALMAEVLRKPYKDPVDPLLATGLGPEAGESGRVTFDDVDDYHGLTEAPPANADGTPVDDADGWSRTVAVHWVSSTGLTGPASLLETGTKRVTVTVRRRGAVAATLVAVRADDP